MARFSAYSHVPQTSSSSTSTTPRGRSPFRIPPPGRVRQRIPITGSPRTGLSPGGLIFLPADDENKSTTWNAFFNITKCFVGAASFELPWAVKQAGLIGGTLGIVLLCIFSNFTLRMLAWCGHLTKQANKLPEPPTYPDIGQQAFGRIGAIAAWTGILSMTVGVCGSYFVFIGHALSCLVAPYHASLTPTVCTCLVLPVIIGLSWLRSYRFLAPTSILGIGALIFALIVSMVDGAKHHREDDSPYALFSLGTYPLFLGNAAFLYLIHSVVLPIEQTMQKPQEYGKALNGSMATVTVVNLLFAVLAYLWYGNDVQGNVINNLGQGVLADMVRILLCLDLLFTAALFLFPVSESLERDLFDASRFGKSRSVEMKRNALRALLVAVTAGVALLIPRFSVLTGLSGALGNNVLGFLLPPLCYLKLTHDAGYWLPEDDPSSSEGSEDVGVLVAPASEAEASDAAGDGLMTDALSQTGDDVQHVGDQDALLGGDPKDDQTVEGEGTESLADVSLNTSHGSTLVRGIPPLSWRYRLSVLSRLPWVKKLEIAGCVVVFSLGLLMLGLSTKASFEALLSPDEGHDSC